MSEKPRLTDATMAKVVERQMRNWELARAQRPERGARPGQGRVTAQFVTIANIVGAGGNDLAAMLSEALKWPVFDRQILTLMAADDDARARLYESMDERVLGWFEDILRSLMQQGFHRNDYFDRLSETIRCLAREGPAIFVGRSADLILPAGRGLRVKVIASLAFCAENFARRNDTTLKHAREEIDRIERERQDFVRRHFRIDAYDPTRFDLLINVERFTTQQAVELILAALKQRGIID